MGNEFQVVGPQMRLPGSDQLMFWVGLLVLAVGVGGVVLVVLVRRSRHRRADAPRRPVALGALVALAVLGLGLAVANRPLPFFVPEFPALPRLFPEQAFFYRTVTDLPVAAGSDRAIASMVAADGRPLGLVASMSGRVVDGVVWGIPFNPVTGATPRASVRMRSPSLPSYTGPYPIADPAYIQTLPSYTTDNHYVAVDPAEGRMWELIGTSRWFGRWEADAGALWDLDALDFPAGSTTASGLPLLPGTITFDQVASGDVGHAVFGSAPVISSGEPVWPARGSDGPSPDPDAPPMGAWLRLKPTVVVDDLPEQARVVARALQEYGMVLADTGGTLAVTGTVDRRWDDDQLLELGRLTAEDFEVVDVSGIMVSADSMEARPVP